MKKFYFFAALLVGAVLTSCTSEDDLALSPPETVVAEEVNVPIVFSSLKNNITRGDITGKAAADSLGNKFVVTGFKGETTANPYSMVFDNYLVEYADNTANTTESNTDNWEYVGKGLIKHAKDNGITKQTIKYWDYSQDQYDFIAWSTGKAEAIFEGNYAKGKVLVSSITPNGKTGTPAWASGMAAYTFSGLAEDLKDCYIADLVTVNKADEGGYGEVKKGYAKPVTLRFRQLGTKVRIGIYETVPGYSVKNVKFYKKSGQLTDKTKEIVDSATIFSTGADIYTEGTYTVSFPTVDKPDSIDNNQAHISFAPQSGVEQTTIVNWGELNYTYRENGEKDTKPVYLGRSSNTATFAGDSASNFYVFYLPNEAGANLNLRVDFTLESIDGSGEIIQVKNANAQVPSIYTTWKPGYAYTYLFKISDKTNGRTGVYDPEQDDGTTVWSDPEGLYPITFDAVVVNAEEDATQETITLIATPSITTYQEKSTVVNANEYTVNGKDIFVTVNENDALVTLTNKAALFSIPAGMTEAEVIDALTYQDDDADPKTVKGRSGKVLDSLDCVTGVNDLTAANTWMLTDTVKFGADGNAIIVRADQALRFKPQANKTYAFVYIKEESDKPDTLMYGALAFDDFTQNQTKYRYGFKAAQAGDVKKDSTYYDANGVVQKVFWGQNVSNLFLDQDGTIPASGYAESDKTYYYTSNNGQSYDPAYNVVYKSSNWMQGLLEKSGDTYSATNDTEPQDGKAYYYLNSDNKYQYCVFLPQQTTDLKLIDTANYVVATEDAAIAGMTYFDKYTKNFDTRYVKVIKVAAE